MRSVAGSRIYLIDIPSNLSEIYIDQKLYVRFGAQCVEPTAAQARAILEQRRAFDWTAEASQMHVSDIVPQAMDSARRHYEEAHEVAPSSLEILRRMNVLIDESVGDPELNRAGALLLTRFEPQKEQISLLITDAEGVASRSAVRDAAPLLPLYDETVAALRDDAFRAAATVVGAQRRSVRAIPERAFREGLVNAMMHRDYQHEQSGITAWAIGNPGSTFKIRSPGGFPPGVTQDRLIAAPSRPRNKVLARALRVLGIAESEGVGIDTMYRLMLRDGHPAPVIEEAGGDVVVLLQGGRPDVVVRSFFDDLYRRDPPLQQDVRVVIAVTELLRASVIRPSTLAQAAECTSAEALALLEQLQTLGVVERLVKGSRSFRLTAGARVALLPRISYTTRRPIEERWERVEALLDTKAEVSSQEIQAALGLSQPRTARIIRALLGDRRLAPVGGRRRGPGVRYRRGPREG